MDRVKGNSRDPAVSDRIVSAENLPRMLDSFEPEAALL